MEEFWKNLQIFYKNDKEPENIELQVEEMFEEN